jgi:hypothetical protein
MSLYQSHSSRYIHRTPLEKEVDVRRERRRKKLVMQSYVKTIVLS